MQSPQSNCQGCGIPIKQPHYGRRLWCSERCRKESKYPAACSDCGARINGWSGRKHGGRCSACAVRYRSETATLRRELIEEMILERRQEGMLNEWIDQELGLPPNTAGSYFYRMRLRGIDVGRSPYYAKLVA